MRQYLLGADGGGSKTAVVLTDSELHVIALKQYGRSNPGDIGYDATEKLIRTAFDEICLDNGIKKSEIAAVFAGIAGLTSGNHVGELISALEADFPHASIDCSHDGINVLYGSFPNGEDGAIIICGTGSSCFAKVGGAIYRIGGCGQFDLKGNGYEIGKAAFAHVFRTMDGRDEYGYLAKSLDAKFDGSCHNHIFAINDYTKTEFARFAPMVFEAARHGDNAAAAILEDHLGYVAELIRTAANCYGGKPYSVALAGGIFKDPLAYEILLKNVPANATVFRMEREPYLGAAAKARAQFLGEGRLTPTAFLKKKFPLK